jgi:ribosomal protein S18 acetylase RimI-like enzyme
MTEPVQLNIRRATIADAKALVDLAARIYYETFAAVNTPENMEAYMSTSFALRQFQSELEDSQAAFYVAEVENAFGGYAKLLATQPPACVTGPAPIELVRFYVDRQWQGTGVAAKLLERCLTDAKRQGFRTMYLGVWEHNDRAIAFYRKWDFTRVGDHIFQMGDDPQTDWWMMRPL